MLVVVPRGRSESVNLAKLFVLEFETRTCCKLMSQSWNITR